MNILAPDNVLTASAGSRAFESVSIWLGEAVFGHRIWYRQTPWLILLEFLNVAEAFQRKSALLDEQTSPSYSLRFRMGLRQILFNGSDLERIASLNVDDESRWTEWLAQMGKQQCIPREGFGYLRERFKSFSDFAQLVRLLRQTGIEAGSNKRWSSRFIFPLGPAALFSDAAVDKSARVVRDYTVFGRSGEMLYQMLCRSDHADELRAHLERLLAPENERNRLVGLLCAPSDDEADRREEGESFLPYRKHPAFDRLAADWLKVLGLGLPDGDALTHLAPLAAFHLMLYQLETAAAALGSDRPVIVCEMIAPRRELVRQHAVNSFIENDALIRRALTERLMHRLTEIRKLADAQDATDRDRQEFIQDRLREEFNLKLERVGTDAELDLELGNHVERKLDQNDGLVHLNYGRSVGLVSRRGTNRNRYAPTDAFLKTLVLVRVDRRQELGLFLADLREQYGLVIGPEEAGAVLDREAFDLSSFDRNRDRLEARLASMGLLNRLSDGCAYVLNPYDSSEERP
ncbi:hypothetical protein SAZ10_19440 [Mesorhizobium sp. BAC0120]|uniref:hypothetical protein n=1 Tax=Mesorhizobium sp. BAC0120 TaxID=3090670 RepID=UPI00298BDF1D|nr:hypothetical protein [Mesorhizobium sp. BAC0120]MDW6023924.1 hypothetical protein [Mesorhizobium sp. BAC0120]